MSGWAIVVLILGVFAFGTAGYCFELWLNKKQREEQKANDDAFWNLITEFDEQHYTPCIVDDTPGTDAQEFKKRLIKIYNKKA